MPDVSVRFASVSDAPAIATIHCESWRRHYRGMYSDRYLDGDLYDERLATWTERLRRDERVHVTLIAEDGNRSIGFAHLILDAHPTFGAHVDNLHVVGSEQRRGIGSILLDHVAQIVIERRPGSGVWLWVLEGNTDAQAFYVARGGELRDQELSPAPGGNLANLHGTPMRVRVVWPDPTRLLRETRPTDSA